MSNRCRSLALFLTHPLFLSLSPVSPSMFYLFSFVLPPPHPLTPGSLTLYPSLTPPGPPTAVRHKVLEVHLFLFSAAKWRASITQVS